MERLKLEAAHAAQIKDMEMERFKLEIQKDRALEHANFVQSQADLAIHSSQLELDRQDQLIKSTVAGHSYKRAASQSPPPVSHPFSSAIPPSHSSQNWRLSDLEKTSPALKEKLNSVTWIAFKAKVKTYRHLTGRKSVAEMLGASHMSFLVAELKLDLDAARLYSDDEWFDKVDSLYGVVKPKFRRFSRRSP